MSVYEMDKYTRKRMIVDGELIDSFAYEYGNDPFEVANQYHARNAAEIEAWYSDACVENAKLRELVAELWGRTDDLGCSVYGTCRDPLCKYNGECSLENKLREMGIVVERW